MLIAGGGPFYFAGFGPSMASAKGEVGDCGPQVAQLAYFLLFKAKASIVLLRDCGTYFALLLHSVLVQVCFEGVCN